MTPKQISFVQEFLVDLNATQAAIRAGYSAKTARAIGARLLTDVDIQQAIQTARQARSERTQIDADWVLRRLAEDSSADISDLYDETGKLKHVKDWPKPFRTGLVAGVETAQMGDGGEVTIRKVRLADRARYLEMIGKHIDVGAFKDRVEVDVVDSLAARLERVRAKRAPK